MKATGTTEAKRQLGKPTSPGGKASKGNGLTDRQRAFVTAYLTNGFNATRAAMSSGHKCNGYGAFGVVGSVVLKNVKVSAAIDDYFRRAGISADEVVARLVEQARANPEVFFDKRWRVKRDVMERKGHLVRKFKPASRVKPAEIELHDAQAALVLIGKHLGMFSEKVQHMGDQRGTVRHEFTVNIAAQETEPMGPKQALRARFWPRTVPTC